MNKEKYFEFLRLQDETEKLRDDAESRVEEIFRCFIKKDKERWPSIYFSIHSIDFKEQFIDLCYAKCACGGDPEYEDMHLPSELIYANDWKEKYNAWSERERQKAKQEELRAENEKGNKERKERHNLYQKLKEEFEG